MRLDVHAFGLARTAGERSEDAWGVDVAHGRLALADGASSSWRAGDWAAALVDAWIAKPPGRPRRGGHAEGLLRWVDGARTAFAAPDAATDRAERPWFADAAAARGAHAALLGVTITGLGGRRPRLRAVAVGDVCLLVVRAGRLVTALPVDDPDAFGSRPALISSLPGGAPALHEVVVHERELRAGDVLLLASDAMAAFLLRLGRLQPDAWDVVGRVDRAGVHRLVEQGLDAGLLERDDLTLLRATVVDGDAAADEDAAADAAAGAA